MTLMPETPAANTAMPCGRAIFFDGTSSARHDVQVVAAATGLKFNAADGGELGDWPYESLRRASAPDGVLRLYRSGDTILARLEIRDAALADAIEDRAATLDRSGSAERALRRKVVGLSVAAVASLIVTAIVGVPALSTRITPLVPLSVERKLGLAVDKQIRETLDTRHLGTAFACGYGAGQSAGRAAIERLVAKLETAAALPVHLSVDVVRRSEPNAFALPGGHVYVFEGLIDAARVPDEVAGVLAHEIGHVAHRDGTRAVLQAAGLSFLFGIMLGDFVGGGAVVVGAKTVLRSSYSRQVEAAADAYSVGLMSEVGGDPHALAAILGRIVSDKQEGLKILRDHPETKDRVVAINAVPAAGAVTPVLDAASWAALKRICATEASTPAAPAAMPAHGKSAKSAAAQPDGAGGQKMNPQ
jgi:Zn-dependent protease with chaperone function